MPIAAIALDFDPILRLGDIAIRWQAVALAAGILAALTWAAVAGRRHQLGADDLLFVVVGTVPGAVVGGRIGHVLGHADYYGANPQAIVDAAQGGLTLATAVAGGLLTGAIVARLLGTPVRWWLHLAAAPTLLAIAIGKLSMVLAGSGQGRPADAAWATAYVGPGPWASLAPDIPSHPAQVYEALVAAGVAAAVVLVLAAGADRERSGRAFFAGIGLWALGRALVATTWRDAQVLGPLGVEQVLTLVLAAGCLVLLAVPIGWAAQSDGWRDPSAAGEGPEWPDPATRPRF
ncbi:MAG TPA: prolipoprotein diacylglyceryl transferase family protein [Clostridia bacterium]|nr:prolipoprotein diacylglyceryl transferase family protein [Clostridia bacterium]